MNILKRLKSLSLKVKILTSLLVLFIGFTGYYYSYLFIPITEYISVDKWMAEKPRSKGEYINYITKLEEVAKTDNIGGKTPQETLSLWVEAVKADDLKKASTYFLITKRKDALDTMRKSRANNVLPEVVNEIDDGGIWRVSKYLGASFETTVDGSPGYYFEFTKNPNNGTWKIDKF